MLYLCKGQEFIASNFILSNQLHHLEGSGGGAGVECTSIEAVVLGSVSGVGTIVCLLQLPQHTPRTSSSNIFPEQHPKAALIFFTSSSLFLNV